MSGVDEAAALGRGTGRRTRTPRGVIASIAAGGAFGAPARYELSRLIHTTRNGFPSATFVTNITGSLALGFLLVLVIERFPPSRYLRPFVATGFLGAFTTFSTFTVETDVLIKDGHVPLAVAYVMASTAAGLAAVWIGIVAGRALPIHRRKAPG